MKLYLLKHAKGGTWYDGWKPYCVIEHCTSGLERMEQHDYGFRCRCCGNMIAWDLTRLAESPLNAGSKPYKCMHSLRCERCNKYWPDKCECAEGPNNPILPQTGRE